MKKLVADSVPDGVKSVLEGYAGTGFFTASILAKQIRVVAVESGEAAAAVFRREVPKAELVEARFEDGFEEALAKIGEGPSVCLLNPPRGGLSPDARRLMTRPLPFFGILYLSCDPPALARDQIGRAHV